MKNGYTGTEAEWLASLVGAAGANGSNGSDGKSAYELACENGFDGSLSEWLASLVGKDGDAAEKGEDGVDGKDGVGIQNVTLDTEGNLSVILTDGTALSLVYHHICLPRAEP